jgi:predicted anti-sigma-YlaC factor YlaD
MALNKGRSISPLVTLAESVCVKQQNRKRFESLLQQVLEFDVNQYPQYRLSNILARQKAKLLLEDIDDLFI